VKNSAWELKKIEPLPQEASELQGHGRPDGKTSISSKKLFLDY
jgi:hypothetical protein